MPSLSPCKLGLETAHTLEEVSAVLGVTRERSRQIENQALVKCRRWCERNGYRFEDLLAGGVDVRLADLDDLD